MIGCPPPIPRPDWMLLRGRKHALLWPGAKWPVFGLGLALSLRAATPVKVMVHEVHEVLNAAISALVVQAYCLTKLTSETVSLSAQRDDGREGENDKHYFAGHSSINHFSRLFTGHVRNSCLCCVNGLQLHDKEHTCGSTTVEKYDHASYGGQEVTGSPSLVVSVPTVVNLQVSVWQL